MKIFKADGLECSLRTVDLKTEPGVPDTLRAYELVINGKGEVLWPNCEGEIFSIDRVFNILKMHHCLESGLSIAWPASASMMAVMVIAHSGESRIFSLQVDSEARHAEIRLFADSPEKIRIRFLTTVTTWQIIAPENLPDSPSVSNESIPDMLFQLGLAGSDGTPGASGGQSATFDTIYKMADHFIDSLNLNGSIQSDDIDSHNPVINIFGYSGGHYSGYPDYSPSFSLGGLPGLSHAADELHSRGFELSCHINARIAEESALRKYPLLQAGVCRDRNGSPIIETYEGRRFNVMDPSHSAWTEHLFMQAMLLRECGADAVQLAHISCRAPAAACGAVWGAGYRKLICRLQSTGLKVWMKGLSDYYPANWFEITGGKTVILPGGIIQCGKPLGKSDFRLLLSLMPQLPACILSGHGSGEDMSVSIYGENYTDVLSKIQKTPVSL